MRDMTTVRQRIIPHLWFDSEAEEAAQYYASVFKHSRLGAITRYTKEGFEFHGQPEGKVLTVDFEIEGQRFVALNGPPLFKFTEAISFLIGCDTQAEIDYYWEKLTAGGDPKAQQCGWLKDKFGVSWQVAPTILDAMLQDPDPEKVARVTRAFLPMKKIDIRALQRAFDGK